MTKKLGISISNYVFRKYLQNHKGNRSVFIEEMFVRGIEAEAAEIDDHKTKYIEAVNKLRDMDTENGRLRKQIAAMKERKVEQKAEKAEHEQKVKERKEADSFAEAMKIHNPLRWQ